MIIKNSKIYDTLKYIARYVLPGLIVLYTAVANAIGLPYVAEVEAIGAAVIVFLNTLLGISNENFNREHDGNE